MTIQIQSPSVDDADELTDIALSAKAFWGYSDDFMQDCKEELRVTSDKIQGNDFCYFVARQEQQILGFYCLQFHRANALELEALFVRPEHIGKGIGKVLFEHAVAQALAQNVNAIDIHSDPNAEAFYLAMGAERIGEQASGSIPGRVLPLMRVTMESV